MPETLQTLLTLLAQVTGSHGGVRYSIVHFVLAATFFGVLYAMALKKYREDGSPREQLLVWGFGLGFAREVFMLSLAVVQALQWVTPTTLHVFFPPLEHMVRTASLILVAGAFIRYLLDDISLTRRYLKVAIGATVLSYVVTFWWWAEFITANPKSKFGQTWCDWVFHINSSTWFLVAAVILARRAKGWHRNTVVTALLMFFVSDFLKLPDMALGEVYEPIFNPISRFLYIAAIPVFGYVYVRETLAQIRSYTDQLEREVRARTIAEQMAESKTSLLATMSHEIRTPLGGMIGMSQLLDKTALSAEQKEFVQNINLAGEGALQLLNDVLDHSKSEAGRMELEHLPFKLTGILQECRSLFELQARKTGLMLHQEVQGSLPKVVVGDPLRVRQVLINLLSNAYKFTSVGRIVLRVSAQQAASDKVMVRFEVQDSGVGMTPEQQAKLFSAYSQADRSISRRFGGTGLGLSICAQLVQLMGGEIGVNSTAGGGSVFWFTIPMGVAPDVEPTHAETHASEEKPDFSRLRILVVDDDGINRRICEGMLKNYDLSARVAHDGEQALNLLKMEHGNFDLVLLDCEMPVMDGYSATRSLRQWEQAQGLGALYVCGVSSHASEEFKQVALDAGMTDYITKPLRMEDLRRVLDNCLRKAGVQHTPAGLH